ncbi:hypothetical protein [Geoglobus sp.]
MSKYREKKRARMVFKKLKAGLIAPEQLSEEDIALLRRYYPFLFKPSEASF